MDILVTGGAGFIGSHLCEALVAKGHTVRVLDNLSTGTLRNLASLENRVNFIEGDIRDEALVELLCHGCQVVFHLAALVSVPLSVQDPQLSHDINLQGTLNVLIGAREAGVKRVVFASSAAVYGEDPELPAHEGQRPAPVSPYGLEKLAGEHYLHIFQKLYGLQTVALRYFNVFGPRQDPSSPYSGVISIFVDRLLAGEAPTIFGDGEQSRDFVFVDNVVQATLLAGLHSSASGLYNIGCGQSTSLKALYTLLSGLCGATAPARTGPARVGDIRHSLADITRATAELGYSPAISVKQGLSALVQHERRTRGL